VNGVRLERGSVKTLVLQHGNGSMIEDFEFGGLIELVAIDRPGFGLRRRRPGHSFPLERWAATLGCSRQHICNC